MTGLLARIRRVVLGRRSAADGTSRRALLRGSLGLAATAALGVDRVLGLAQQVRVPKVDPVLETMAALAERVPAMGGRGVFYVSRRMKRALDRAGEIGEAPGFPPDAPAFRGVPIEIPEGGDL